MNVDLHQLRIFVADLTRWEWRLGMRRGGREHEKTGDEDAHGISENGYASTR